METTLEQYCIICDRDSHLFVIPCSRKQEWEDWISLPEDDELGWEIPLWADPINGPASSVTFPAYTKT